MRTSCSVNQRISPGKSCIYYGYSAIKIKCIFCLATHKLDISNKSTPHFHVMQPTHPSPILDLTVDHPMLSNPDPIVDLTKAASISAPSSNGPTKHDTSPHASSSSESATEETMFKDVSYLVKVVDPAKKGLYKVHKLRTTVNFTKCSDIRSALNESLAEHVPEGGEYDIGYIEPSKQGVRGKTRWIFNESDIEDMYKEYQEAQKTEIVIWCDGRAKTLPNKSVTVKRKCFLNLILRKSPE